MSFRTAYGYTYSENGWRMCNRDECALPISPGMTLIDTAPIRTGAPLTILSAWLKYYDVHVAEVSSPVWGWSERNDVPDSNHLSGTALDINAPQWPWGTRTMPADMKVRIRKGLGLFESTVFWGADWARADEMHFQMAFREGDARNAAFAAKLRAGHLGIYPALTTPPPAAKGPLGMTPDEIRALILEVLERYVGPIGSDVKDIREQLTGARDLILGPEGIDLARSYPGYPDILGTRPDGSGRTLTDAIGELLRRTNGGKP
ncbi:putative lysin [Skermania phage SPI1]|nr:putative lysin [Skermania phage SPI1]